MAYTRQIRFRQKWLIAIVAIRVVCHTVVAVGDSNNTNAFDGIVHKSKGLGWEAPMILEGEPNLTGFTVFWSPDENKTNAEVFVHFDFSTSSNMTTNAELIVNGLINYYVATNYPSDGATNTYFWSEYPFDTPTNTVKKMWFWVTASNETGAVSGFSEPATITLDFLRPKFVQPVYRE